MSETIDHTEEAVGLAARTMKYTCTFRQPVTVPETTGRKQADTLFKPGQSGNPDGRPRGARNATTLALEALLDGQANALTQKAIDLALTGDMAALRLCLDRILPPRKDRPVIFTLPDINSAQDAAAVVSSVLAAVATGEITPDGRRRSRKTDR